MVEQKCRRPSYRPAKPSIRPPEAKLPIIIWQKEIVKNKGKTVLTVLNLFKFSEVSNKVGTFV